jgi:hypothetical protein
MRYNCRVDWGADPVQLLKAMRLSRAVTEIPAKISVPPGLPLNKSRPLTTHSESTLPQLLIPFHFISFSSNVYKKTGGGATPSQPQRFATRHYLLADPTRAHAHEHPFTPSAVCEGQPQSLLCFTSRLYGCTRWSQDPPSGTANLGCLPPYFGPRVTEHGPRVTEHGPRVTEHGPRVTEHGPRAMAPLVPQYRCGATRKVPESR